MEDVLLPLALGLGAYVALVIAVGALATRRSARSPEEYFLAGRGLGTPVLFMALFGTNCTAFVLVGIPGLAYRGGIGVFGLNAPIIALGIPLSFWAIGVPARRMARRLGALTPAELYAARLGSRAVGLVLFAVFTVYTIPYMVTAVDGAALAVEHVSEGRVPALWGGAGTLAVALLYTSLGGMRATAWTNVVQGALFLGFMVFALFAVPRSMGGFAAAMEKVRDASPALLARGEGGLYEPRAYASWSLAIAGTVIAFPHMLVRLFAAKDEVTLQRICKLYPPALALLWLPAVLIGVWGAAEVPGLEVQDEVFYRMVLLHLPPVAAAAGFLAVLAAVMSTLDAQLLTLGSMLTRDVLDPLRGPAAPERDVHYGRLFGALIALVVFLLWRAGWDTIFGVASIAFSGYVTLVPVLLLGARWRRFNAAGAIASVVAGNAVLLAALAGSPTLAGAATRPAWLGFLPVAWGFAAAFVAAVAIALVTSPPDPERTARAFGAGPPPPPLAHCAVPDPR